MFVMNFGAGQENPYVPATIPNEAITSQDGFPGQGMPLLWLLNANEGSGYPLRVVNFLNRYAHRRDVYAAIVVPGEIRGFQDANYDGQPDDVNEDGVIDDADLVDIDAYGITYGPIWDNAGGPIDPPGRWGFIPLLWGPPVIEIDVSDIRLHQQDQRINPNGLTELQALTWTVGHELGHTVLWHHQPGYGHHAGNTTFDCLIWPEMDWRPNPPPEFCVANPGCQTRWKVNP